jgi:hypothetical protein
MKLFLDTANIEEGREIADIHLLGRLDDINTGEMYSGIEKFAADFKAAFGE